MITTQRSLGLPMFIEGRGWCVRNERGALRSIDPKTVAAVRAAALARAAA